MKKILIYSHDTFGLGNIRRMLAIANHLVAVRADVTVLILSGSPMLHAFRLSPGIDYVKLPCLERTVSEGYKVKNLGVDMVALMRLRSNLILTTVIGFQPDVILVDKKPLGVGRELAPAFELMRLHGLAPRCALILRDILDSTQRTIKVWQKQQYFEAIDRFYERILVLGSAEIFNLPEEYRFPQKVKDKVRLCGYLDREPGLHSRKEVRTKLGVGELPLVLVTTGGGSDGNGLISTYLEGLQKSAKTENYHSLILCGPEMAASDRAQFKLRASELPRCQIRDFSDDVMSYMAAADLVIAMGGYNTVGEILALEKPAIIVPRKKPVREQWIRAQRMSRLGFFEMIDPCKLTAPILMNRINTMLYQDHKSPTPQIKLNRDGLETVVAIVETLLEQRNTEDTAIVRGRIEDYALQEISPGI